MGTIFRVDREGHATAFASLPSSVAAFHLALSPDQTLHVTGPTLATYDPVHVVDGRGQVSARPERFGRPQGIAFDRSGALHVVEALAGVSGVYRLRDGAEPELVLSGPGLVGLAFGQDDAIVVCSNDTAFRLPAAH
jgi:hypothetical protein